MTKSLSSLIKEARRALDASDADAALRHCRAALKTHEGAKNVKLLLLTAQACQALDPPRLDDALRMIEKAAELDPDSIQCWGLMRNLLRQLQPDPERVSKLRRVYEKLLSLCANDPEAQRRLKHELIEILESSNDKDNKIEALKIRLQMLPLSDDDLIRIVRSQLDLGIDSIPSIRELISRRSLPNSLLEEAVSVIFTDTIKSGSEGVWSERLSLLLDLSNCHFSKLVLQNLVSLLLAYRRIFDCEKPFLRRVCCAFVRLAPNDSFAWAALSCISVPSLSDAPEILGEVRAGVRIGELSTSNVPFPNAEPLPLSMIFAECHDTVIRLQLELRPLNLVPIKTRLRSALELIDGIRSRCPDLESWKEAVKVSLRISAYYFKPASESATMLESRHHLHARAMRALINLLIASDRFSDAVRFIEEFWPKASPTWALSALSWCRFKMSTLGHEENFLEDAATVISRSPRCSLYHTRIGRMYFALAENPSVYKPRALDSFMTAARLDPLSSHPWTSLGGYYREYKRDMNRALKCFRKAVSLDPTDSEAGVAVCDLLPPDSDELVSVCKATIDTNPFFCEWPWRYLLKARLLRQEWLDCVGAIQNLLKSSPKDIQLWMQLGLVYLRMGKFQSSARAYHQAVTLDDNNVRAHYSLSDVYLRMDQPVDAIGQLEHALSLETGELRPAVVELLRQTYYVYGKQLAQSDSCEDAKLQLDKAINLPILASNLLGTWKLIGDIQIARSEPLCAAKAYTRAVVKLPHQAEAWYNLGVALYKAKLLSVASHCLKSAIRIQPDYADAWIVLAFTIPSSRLQLRSYCLSRAVRSSGLQSAAAWSAFALLALHYGDVKAAQHAVVEAQRSDPIFEHLPCIQGLIFRASVAIAKDG